MLKCLDCLRFCLIPHIYCILTNYYACSCCKVCVSVCTCIFLQLSLHSYRCCISLCSCLMFFYLSVLNPCCVKNIVASMELSLIIRAGNMLICEVPSLRQTIGSSTSVVVLKLLLSHLKHRAHAVTNTCLKKSVSRKQITQNVL